MAGESLIMTEQEIKESVLIKAIQERIILLEHSVGQDRAKEIMLEMIRLYWGE